MLESYGDAGEEQCAERGQRKVRCRFLHRGKWWVAWTDDVPGALTQGRTLDEARENLKDAIALMLEPVDVSRTPPNQIQKPSGLFAFQAKLALQ